jgi:prevent-host-death family protein
MTMLKTTDWIIPTTELQSNLTTVLENAQQRPLVVTNEGKPAAYVVSVEFFDRLVARLLEYEQAALQSNIATGEEHFATGNFLTLTEALRLAEDRWQAQESANA